VRPILQNESGAVVMIADDADPTKNPPCRIVGPGDVEMDLPGLQAVFRWGRWEEIPDDTVEKAKPRVPRISTTADWVPGPNAYYRRVGEGRRVLHHGERSKTQLLNQPLNTAQQRGYHEGNLMVEKEVSAYSMYQEAPIEMWDPEWETKYKEPWEKANPKVPVKDAVTKAYRKAYELTGSECPVVVKQWDPLREEMSSSWARYLDAEAHGADYTHIEVFAHNLQNRGLGTLGPATFEDWKITPPAYAYGNFDDPLVGVIVHEMGHYDMHQRGITDEDLRKRSQQNWSWLRRISKYAMSSGPVRYGETYAECYALRHSPTWDIIPQEMRSAVDNFMGSVVQKRGKWAPGPNANWRRTDEGVALPPAPGTAPIPEGSVRLYHQTSEENVESIQREGLTHAKAKGIEGPRAVYAGEEGFYFKPGMENQGKATVEFHVPKDKWSAPNIVLQDVPPENIVAVHLRWHEQARYFEDNPEALQEALSGDLDDLGEPEALAYIKAKHGVQKDRGWAPGPNAMWRRLGEGRSPFVTEVARYIHDIHEDPDFEDMRDIDPLAIAVHEATDPEGYYNDYEGTNQETATSWKEHGVMAKKASQDRLYERLKDDPDFMEYMERRWDLAHLSEDPRIDEANAYYATRDEIHALVGEWAATSGDSSPIALAMQEAAVEEFGLTDIRASGPPADMPPGILGDYHRHLKEDLPAYRAFLRAQYDETQDFLQQSGIKEVLVWRGGGLPVGATIPEGSKDAFGEASLVMHPMTSWSTSVWTAEQFMGTTSGNDVAPTLFATVIPADRILSTPATGYGCYREREVVVLGGPMKGYVWAQDPGRDYDDWTKAKIPGGPSGWMPLETRFVDALEDWEDGFLPADRRLKTKAGTIVEGSSGRVRKKRSWRNTKTIGLPIIRLDGPDDEDWIKVVTRQLDEDWIKVVTQLNRKVWKAAPRVPRISTTGDWVPGPNAYYRRVGDTVTVARERSRRSYAEAQRLREAKGQMALDIPRVGQTNIREDLSEGTKEKLGRAVDEAREITGSTCRVEVYQIQNTLWGEYQNGEIGWYDEPTVFIYGGNWEEGSKETLPGPAVSPVGAKVEAVTYDRAGYKTGVMLEGHREMELPAFAFQNFENVDAGLVVHEFGHDEARKAGWTPDNIRKKYAEGLHNGYLYSVSKYAVKNGGEAYAECYALRLSPTWEKVPEDMKEWINGFLAGPGVKKIWVSKHPHDDVNKIMIWKARPRVPTINTRGGWVPGPNAEWKRVGETGYESAKQAARDAFVAGQEFPETTGSLEEETAPEPETDYRIAHQPHEDYGARGHDLTQIVQADIYDHPEWYPGGEGQYPEVVRAVRQMRGNPDAEVTIYRAVPKDPAITDINPGDWVTLSKPYAETHGESKLSWTDEYGSEIVQWPEGYRILEKKVKAKDIVWPGDFLPEWGYFPEAEIEKRRVWVPGPNAKWQRLDEVPWPPVKTVKAYKIFEVRDGQLYTLFISEKDDGKKKVPVPVGEWVKADSIPTKGYAVRPGWHAGELPVGPHLRSNKGLPDESITATRVWAEVELPADVDWQTVADRGLSEDRWNPLKGEIPVGGYYRFNTQSRKAQGGTWLIGGGVRVNRVLPNDEVGQILRDAGRAEDAVREQGPAADEWFKIKKVWVNKKALKRPPSPGKPAVPKVGPTKGLLGVGAWVPGPAALWRRVGERFKQHPGFKGQGPEDKTPKTEEQHRYGGTEPGEGKREAPTGWDGIDEQGQERILQHMDEMSQVRADDGSFPAQNLPKTPEEAAENVKRLAAQGTPQQIAEAKVWYDKAAMACEEDMKYGFTYEQTVGVTAVLSPTRDWENNFELAHRINQVVGEDKAFFITPQQFDAIYEENRLGMHGPGWYRPSELTEVQLALTHTAFQDAIAKSSKKPIGQIASAVRILRSDGRLESFEAELGGAKISSFYNNIHDPWDPRFVTIDTHQIRAMVPEDVMFPYTKRGGEVVWRPARADVPGGEAVDSTWVTNKPSYKERGQEIYHIPKGTGSYAFWVEGMKIASKDLGMLPNELQALTWLIISGRDQ
jgi:hypothetical protein